MKQIQNNYAKGFDTKHLSILLDDLPFMLCVNDIHGNFIFSNSKAKLFLEKGIDYTSDMETLYFNADTLKRNLLERNSDVFKNGLRFEFEKELTTIENEKYLYSFSKSPIKDKSGTVCAVITHARNIEIEREMKEQRETYIATLSHDLKTPTIAQVRALELLLSGQLGSFNDEQKEILNLILDSCHYMYEMVYTLLSTCKFESGETALSYSNFDLINIVSDCIKEIGNLTIDNSTTLIFKPKIKTCVITADRIQIKRVIINFLTNAINYAFRSSKIEITINAENNNVEFKVKNSSTYIDENTMQKIFRKYVSHSEKYNKVGMGLGLYLSKKIIEAHNGKIIAKSSKSQHCTFGFEVPINPFSKTILNDK